MERKPTLVYMKLKEAARKLGVMQSMLLHIVEVGETVPSHLVIKGESVWSAETGIGFSGADIEAFQAEIDRRCFKALRREYSDLLAEGGELAFGPGWTAIMSDFLAGMREAAAGKTVAVQYAKEKFGNIQVGVRCDEVSKEFIESKSAELRARSLLTCEECGQPGRLRLGTSICKTTCDHHARLVGELRPEDGRYADVQDWLSSISE